MLDAWAKLDEARALHPADRAAIASTEPARSLVAELLTHAAERHERDLWNACARLGAMLADEGASPSLAASTIDHAATACGVTDAARIANARASLLEGYVGAVRDRAHADDVAQWDYPHCVVPLGDGVVAVACGRPADESLAEWAAHVASKLSRAKVKRAVLAGNDAAKSEVASALELVGIALGPAPAAAKSWLPWRR